MRKPPVPKTVVKKKKRVKKDPADDQIIDYSHLYGSFYEIFNAFVQNQKYFDPSQTL
jgi:hypothetical protein